MSDKSETTPKTVRVRIAVAVDCEGQWSAFGIWREDDKGTKDNVFIDDLEPGEHYHWVEATLPVPVREHTQTVEGEVTNAKS